MPTISKIWLSKSANVWIASESIAPEPVNKNATNLATITRALPTMAAATAVLELGRPWGVNVPCESN